MPPKVTYTREQVVEAGLDIIREGGTTALSARNVARHLGSSTAPVYQQFDSMDALAGEVLVRVRDMLIESARRRYTGRVFLDIGVGFAAFARDEPGLFRALYMESHNHMHILEDVMNAYVDIMADEPIYQNLDRSERRALLWKMATYTIGVAVQMITGDSARTDDAFIISTLGEVGHAVTKEHLAALGMEALPRVVAGPDASKPRT